MTFNFEAEGDLYETLEKAAAARERATSAVVAAAAELESQLAGLRAELAQLDSEIAETHQEVKDASVSRIRRKAADHRLRYLSVLQEDTSCRVIDAEQELAFMRSSLCDPGTSAAALRDEVERSREAARQHQLAFARWPKKARTRAVVPPVPDAAIIRRQKLLDKERRTLSALAKRRAVVRSQVDAHEKRVHDRTLFLLASELLTVCTRIDDLRGAAVWRIKALMRQHELHVRDLVAAAGEARTQPAEAMQSTTHLPVLELSAPAAALAERRRAELADLDKRCLEGEGRLADLEGSPMVLSEVALIERHAAIRRCRWLLKAWKVKPRDLP